MSIDPGKVYSHMADTLVLLHPGGADPSAFGPQFDALADFALHAPHRVDQATQDHTEMALETIAFLERTGPAHLLGCSDGATVALLTALHRPDLVQRLVIVCGVFHHDGWDPGDRAHADAPPFPGIDPSGSREAAQPDADHDR